MPSGLYVAIICAINKTIQFSKRSKTDLPNNQTVCYKITVGLSILNKVFEDYFMKL